jgi:hypothetical protein
MCLAGRFLERVGDPGKRRAIGWNKISMQVLGCRVRKGCENRAQEWEKCCVKMAVS